MSATGRNALSAEYFFAADGAPGDVNGQGINDVWYVMGADGIGIGAPVADAATSLDY